jgi:predicted metal-binding membrane protein
VVYRQLEGSMTTSSPLEAVLKRDRIVVVGGLLLIVVLSWAYILLGAGVGMTAFDMTGSAIPSFGGSDMSGKMPAGSAISAMMQPALWDANYAVLMFFMWWIMMVAMMLPSAAPMILLYAAINRKQRERNVPYVPSAVFGLGYLACWAAFSVVAVSLQWALESAGFLSGMMRGTSQTIGGGLLIAAGTWQVTPLKHACLRHCRSPIIFLTHHWHKGYIGAFRMGVEHGVFCLGCCWFLMALLFYGGIMNLYWIIGLALYVLVEKFVPKGHWIGVVVGVVLLVWGVALIGSAWGLA